MRLGIGVPTVYIVPVERFCREVGPALGINLAEFEFPAYFSYFVRGKRCTLVVDSKDAENNIRRVFSETLLGPEVFRNHDNPTANNAEDFDPSFPEAKRPNFYKEFYHFRTAEASTSFKELTIDDLVEFCHFKGSEHSRDTSRSVHSNLGVPPDPPTGYVTDEDQIGNKCIQSRRHSANVQSQRETDMHDKMPMSMPQSLIEQVPLTKPDNEKRHSMQGITKRRQLLLRKTRSYADLKEEAPHSPDDQNLSGRNINRNGRRVSWKRATDENSWCTFGWFCFQAAL
jgi:hypothetical protein